MYLPAPSHKHDMIQDEFFKQSLAGLNSVFLLLDWLPYQDEKAQSVLLITHGWRENSWSYTFPKDISAMVNTNSLIQGLKLSGHFQRK